MRRGFVVFIGILGVLAGSTPVLGKKDSRHRKEGGDQRVECVFDKECGPGGFCTLYGTQRFCAVPDSTCPKPGLRFTETAPSEIRLQCFVPPPAPPFPHPHHNGESGRRVS